MNPTFTTSRRCCGFTPARAIGVRGGVAGAVRGVPAIAHPAMVALGAAP